MQGQEQDREQKPELELGPDKTNRGREKDTGRQQEKDTDRAQEMDTDMGHKPD